MYRFTTEFGMGSGGSSTLLSSGKLVFHALAPMKGIWEEVEGFTNINDVLAKHLRQLLALALYSQASRVISIG